MTTFTSNSAFAGTVLAKVVDCIEVCAEDTQEITEIDRIFISKAGAVEELNHVVLTLDDGSKIMLSAQVL